jgi:glycosyltransferase involved in cell wall biosynthesis
MAGKSVFIGIPVLLSGGTEIQTLSLVRVLIGEGYRVTVGCYYEYDQGMVSRYRAAAAEVLLMRRSRQEGRARLLQALVRFLISVKPDIVHVQYLAPGFVPILAARLAGCRRVFASVHYPGEAFGRRERFTLRTASRLCSAFTCNSRAVERSWFGLKTSGSAGDGRRGNHRTIYNCVDLVEVERAAGGADRETLCRDLGIGGRRVIGVVGRLREEKGQERLMMAIPGIAAEVPEAVLLVVGDGPDRDRLHGVAERLRITGRVVWAGERSHDETLGLYTIMDLVVVPSRYEGFSLAAAEAMAAARPVVAAAVGGIPEVVEDGETGFLVPASGGFSGPIVQLLRDPEKARALGSAGRARVERLFSPERYRDEIRALYAPR